MWSGSFHFRGFPLFVVPYLNINIPLIHTIVSRILSSRMRTSRSLPYKGEGSLSRGLCSEGLCLGVSVWGSLSGVVSVQWGLSSSKFKVNIPICVFTRLLQVVTSVSTCWDVYLKL